MAPTTRESRSWVDLGTTFLWRDTEGLTDTDMTRDSTLPGWTVGQLVAHIAANADALSNLVTWAATGVETPMYPSVEARNAALETARERGADDLLEWLHRSANTLDAGMDALTDEQWQAEIRTIQGRTLRATQIPWLRAREVCVHVVDLGRGTRFADLPEDFLRALRDEIAATRALDRLPDGPLPDVTAWLAGRDHTLTDAPALGPWL